MAPKIFGYARVSTDDQDLTLQIAALKKHGVDAMFSEHASGKTVQRKELKRVLRLLRRGDTLVVWKLDRLGRDLKGVLEVIEDLNKDGIELVSLTEMFDTKSPMGKAFLQISLVFAELERNMISERTKVGMAAKRAAGQRYGRKPLIWKGDRGSKKRIAYLQEMDDAGELREWREGEWVMIPRATALLPKLNLQVNMDKPTKTEKGDLPIDNPETLRRWARDGYPGLREKDGS